MAADVTSDELEVRKRRALWRAGHRGTKELDLVIGGYAGAMLAAMPLAEFERFEAFLRLEETDLQAWLLGPDPVKDVAFADVINAVRAFHGLTAGG